MRIVFLGTPQFAVPSLTALAAAGHTIAAVVTQPDRPRGRGHRIQPSEVKTAAETLGAVVLQPTRLKDPEFGGQIAALGADLGVVAAYGRIIPNHILETPRLGMINVHASLLPRWRGAAPVHRAIIAGDRETGVTIMRVVLKLDAGPMLAKVTTAIGANETSPDLEDRLAALGADLLVHTAAELASGTAREEAQDEALVTYAAKLDKGESPLDWNQPSNAIHNRIRGLQPWPLAAGQFQGKRVLFRAALPASAEDHRQAPGTVIQADRDGIVVAAAVGAVRLLELQLEGRPPVSAAAFLNGHVVKGRRSIRMNAARLAAARTLLALESERKTMAAEMERERPELGDVRDRALFMEIVTGTVRWRAELDACIAAHSNRSIDELMPEVRAALRTGAYQLLHLDRVPSHAAVSETVDVVRALGQPRAAGLVNAVLRKLAGPDARRTLPPRPVKMGSDPELQGSDHIFTGQRAALRYLSISLSHPQWLIKRWLDRHGFEATERWCKFNNTSPTVTVRPLPGTTTGELIHRLNQAAIDAVPARFAKDTLQLAPGTLGRLESSLRDTVVIQDEGSVLVAMAADARPGERVLDVCAAPGGKTIVLAGAVGPSGSVFASDVRPARVELLRTLLDRAGVHVPVLALDAAAGLPFGPVFDRVVVDAPCSGLGTLRRDPDIKWIRKESDLNGLAEMQSRMIDQAAMSVRPGGRLVYATCSSEPEENEMVIDAFLSRAPAFTIEPLGEGLDPALITPRGFLCTLPPRDDLDAFFAAKLVRSEGA